MISKFEIGNSLGSPAPPPLPQKKKDFNSGWHYLKVVSNSVWQIRFSATPVWFKVPKIVTNNNFINLELGSEIENVIFWVELLGNWATTFQDFNLYL